MGMWTPPPRRRQGVGGTHALLLLVVLAVLLTLTAAHSSDASTVLYVYDDGHDAAAEPQSIVTAREREHADRIALQSLYDDDSDRAFFAVDRLRDDGSPRDASEITVRVGGHGRRRSDGVSILRARDHRASDVVIFTPPQLDVSWVESCLPTMHNIRAENHGESALRIDGVHFDHEALSLASDPRGVVLEPTQSLQISIFFVSSQPEQLEAFMFLQTSQGQFTLPVRGLTKPNPHGLMGLRVSVPTGARLEHTIRFHNPHDQVVRVSEAYSLDGVGDIVLPNHEEPTTHSPSLLSMWEVDSQSTKSIARFVFDANRPPGRYQSIVQVVLTATTQFVVPIQINVVENQFVIEPNEVDIGVFINDRERRDVSLTFHNMGSRPVAIHGLRVVESHGIDVYAELQGAPVIPPRSRVQRAVVLKSRSRNGSRQGEAMRHSGPCRLQLQFETNASSSHDSHSVQVRAFSTRGHLSYSLADTAIRITDHLVQTELEPADGNPNAPATNVVKAGSSVLRELVLTNSFDTELELEAVMLSPFCADATIESFSSGMAGPANPFPAISIRIRPDPAIHTHTRVCSLQVQTNASIHTIPIVLYTGAVAVKASRPVTTLSPCQTLKKTGGACETKVQPAKGCRQVVLEMGKVTASGTIEEVFNITNTSPIGLRVSMRAPMHRSQMFRNETTLTIHPDPHVPVELAALGVAWRQAKAPRKRNPRAEILAPGDVMFVKSLIWLDTEQTGKFLESLALIETQFETIEILIRFESVEGEISPGVQQIDIQHIHPGRLGYVRVPFTSAFQHDVHTRDTKLMHIVDTRRKEEQREVFATWRLPKVFPANTTSYVTIMYFPPEFYAACRRGRFYADCFAPRATASPSSLPDFSGYGQLVTATDIARLEKRELQWDAEQQRAEGGLERRVTVFVAIKTDALNTNAVRVSTVLTRPRFFRNDVSVTGVSFPLTELLQQVAAYVNVFNPSDYAMDVELAIAQHDRNLFYECDDDMTEVECLREWQDIARERVEMGKQNRKGSANRKLASTPFAPMFFKARTVRVVGQGYTQLGPIYFFPSTIGEWKTSLYVRNELTHIEPFAVAASSGFGELTVTLVASDDKGMAADELVDGGEIHFATSEVTDGSDTTETTLSFRSSKALVVANTGTFQTALNSIRLYDSKVNKNIKAFAFSAAGAVDSSGKPLRFWAVQDFVLEPQEELRFQIEFTTDCFHSRRETEMRITTRDGVTTHRLVGLLPVDASFQCRRQFWTERMVQMTRWLWLVGSSVGGLAVLIAMWTLMRSGRTQARIQFPTASFGHEVVQPQSDAVAQDAPCVRDTELLDQLTRLEQASLKPSCQPHSVTPAVAKLRASRQRTNGKLLSNGKHAYNPKTPAPVSVSVEKVDSVDAAKRLTPKAKKHSKSKSRSPQVESDAERSRPNKPLSEVNESQTPGNQRDAEGEPFQAKGEVPGHVTAMPPQVEESITRAIAEKEDALDEVVETNKDHSVREDTASEEESDDQQDEMSSVAAVEIASAPAPVIGVPSLQEEEDDGVVLVGMDDVDAFPMPLLSTDNRLLQPPTSERLSTLSFDDDWNALAFDSLQSEIGRLFGAEEGPFDTTDRIPAAQSEVVPAGDVNAHSSSLGSLSMAPPLLPMSSLFGSSVPSLLPPQPRPRVTKAAPPGFSPADANPEASRAAFGRLLQPTPATPLDAFALPAVDASASLQSAFSGRYSLFGPHLGHGGGSPGLFHSTPSSLPVGAIGASRGARSRRGSLGGVELSTDSHPTVDQDQ